MRMFLETHRYAPELNVLHFRGVAFKVPHCMTIKSAREYCFPKPRNNLAVTVSTHYPQPFKGLERVYTGKIENRKQALRFARELRCKNPGGITLAGNLPPLVTKIKIHMGA